MELTLVALVLFAGMIGAWLRLPDAGGTVEEEMASAGVVAVAQPS